MAGEAVELVARHMAAEQTLPYERLLGDAIQGDPMLFTREDAVEAAWAVVEPVLGQATRLYEYEPGTWGPREAEGLVEGGEGWEEPGADEGRKAGP
jgi:glucose-6-phosphate 1-dehydrogenase